MKATGVYEKLMMISADNGNITLLQPCFGNSFLAASFLSLRINAFEWVNIELACADICVVIFAKSNPLIKAYSTDYPAIADCLVRFHGVDEINISLNACVMNEILKLLYQIIRAK